jgi:hypothetical protein
MRTISTEKFIATTALIEFEDGPVSFRVPCGATLVDISEKMDRIGKWHRGQPISIDVRFRVADEDGYSRARRISAITSSVFQPAAGRTVSSVAWQNSSPVTS